MAIGIENRCMGVWECVGVGVCGCGSAWVCGCFSPILIALSQSPIPAERFSVGIDIHKRKLPPVGLARGKSAIRIGDDCGLRLPSVARCGMRDAGESWRWAVGSWRSANSQSRDAGCAGFFSAAFISFVASCSILFEGFWTRAPGRAVQSGARSPHSKAASPQFIRVHSRD